jgi:hydrogenase/urease accessory protein HupE
VGLAGPTPSIADSARERHVSASPSRRTRSSVYAELGSGLAFVALVVVLGSASLLAHPAPFSYVDLRIDAGHLEATVVVHDFDVAHELGIEPVERLLDAAFAQEQAARIAAILGPRFEVRIDGQIANATWSIPDVLADRQSLRFRVTYPDGAVPGVVTVRVDAFPYDPLHQTFLNVYEGGALKAQEIPRPGQAVEYVTGTRQGIWAVVRRFVPSGVHHILIGPDHILFLVGLLLTGGSIRRLVVMVTAFTLAHSVTLTLAALGILAPPAWVIEPAIALSIVFVGVDNLLRGSGRDVREWIAFGFGFIHGFGFANVLGEMGLPAQALGWALASFNIGVEIGQVAVVATVAGALYAVTRGNDRLRLIVARAGSYAVIAAGAYWFVERTWGEWL